MAFISFIKRAKFLPSVSTSTSHYIKSITSNHNKLSSIFKSVISKSYSTPTSSAFVSSLFTPSPNDPNQGFTENGALSNISTLEPRLDLFYKLHSWTLDDTLLEKSWEKSPDDTLRIIFHAGSVKNGKSDKKAFLRALYWLSQHHPQTFIANLKHVPKHTYWKDLLHLLACLNIGSHDFQKDFIETTTKEIQFKLLTPQKSRKQREEKKLEKKKNKSDWLESLKLLSDEAKLKAKQFRAKYVIEIDKIRRSEIKALKMKKHEKQLLHTKIKQLEPFYKKAQDEVVRLFSEQLKTDLQLLNSNSSFEEKKNISLAGKWAPSYYGCFDKICQITPLIAQYLYPEEKFRLVINGIPGPFEVYQSKIVQMLRQQYYTPLRNHIQIPEKYMSANQWGVLPYRRVPSVCMRNNSKHFLSHDLVRFSAFLDSLRTGKYQVASGALLPHQIVHDVARYVDNRELSILAQAQWDSYVKNIKDSGKLTGFLPVCDLSGSMQLEVDKRTTCLDVCIALGLLISEIAEEPFKDLVCTFSKKPQFHKVEGSKLVDRINSLIGTSIMMNMNTDFQAVFDLILKKAKENKLTNDQMIKKIIVFSDMQFDEASSTKTDYQQIKDKFKIEGYDLPEIVFWNLNPFYSASAPVTSNNEGVSLITGFSGNLLKLFMDNEIVEEQQVDINSKTETDLKKKKSMDPISIMEKAIRSEKFDGFEVLD